MGPAVATIVVTTLLGGGRTIGWIRKATTAASQTSDQRDEHRERQDQPADGRAAHATAPRCGRISLAHALDQLGALGTVELAQGARPRERSPGARARCGRGPTP